MNVKVLYSSLCYFSERFGVHWVNFSHPDRPRIPKKSAIELKKIFAENGFPEPEPEPEPVPDTSTKLAVSLIAFAFAFVVVIYGRVF